MDIIQKHLKSKKKNKMQQNTKKHLDVILQNTNSIAPTKIIIAAAVAKIVYPDWDTRLHQIKIGGDFSLRSFDKNYVSSSLFTLRLVATPTEGALSRSFEKSEPYNLDYSGAITPTKVKNSFLFLMQIINEQKIASNVLIHALRHLRNQQNQVKLIKCLVPTKPNTGSVSYNMIHNMLMQCFSICGKSSVIAPIIVYCLCTTVQPYLWKNAHIKILKEHTAPDCHHSIGDIEGFTNENKPFLCIEIKHNTPIDDTTIEVFNEKVKGHDIPLKYILQSKNILPSFSDSCIHVCSVSSFVVHTLQHANCHTSNDLKIVFLDTVFSEIINYDNLQCHIKKTIKQILQK